MRNYQEISQKFLGNFREIHRNGPPYQTTIIRSTSNPKNSQVALVVLPTGCGKTGVAVLASYVLNASRVLLVIITPQGVVTHIGAVEPFATAIKMFDSRKFTLIA